MPRFISITLRVLFTMLVLVLLAIGGALLALRIPSVQTKIAHEAAAILTDKLKHQVIVTRVDIRPFTRVLLEGVRVLDRRGNELFNIGRADADIKLFSIFDPSHLHVGKLTLVEPRFDLVTYASQPDSTNLDEFIGAVKRLLGPADATKKASKPFDFQIEGIGLRNARFVLDRQDEPKAPTYGKAMDYAHMYIDSVYADASQLWLKGDTIHALVNGLRAIDIPSQTRLRELTADMTYAGKFWEFKGLNLRVQNSQLLNYLRFEYKHFLNFTDFNDSVRVVANLGPSRIYSDDIAKFAPQVEDWNETVLISGEAKGIVKNFTTKNLDVRYGKNTHVVGNINVEGLPNLQASFVQMQLQPSVIDGRDIRRYIPASGWPYVQRLGTVRFQGQFLGFYNDFVANGKFNTALGDVKSDVNIKFKTDPRFSTYEGQVTTKAFQLGRLLGQEDVIRDITMNGRVEGVGFTPEGARLTANATVQSIWLNGYRYHNVSTNGKFRQQAFAGKLSVNDPSLQVTADGSVDLNKKHQAFDVRAQVRRADLHALGLVDQHVTVATTADLHFTGLQLDELLGRVQLRNSELGFQGRTVPIDTFDVVSQRTGDQRQLTVRSEALNLNAAGNYRLTNVIRDVQTLITEYQLNFESDDAAIAKYYRRKRQQAISEYQIDLDLDLKRFNPVLHLFMPQLSISDFTHIDGSFRNAPTSIFSLGGHIENIQYDSIRAVNNEFEFTTSKLPNQPEVLAQANITSERQVIPGLGNTERFYVEGVWDQERINFSTSLAQTGTANKASINGALSFLPNAVQVVFRESGLDLLNKHWTIAPNNSVVISGKGKELDIKNLTISNGPQSVSAQGFISTDPAKQLQLTVKDFQLATLSALTTQNIKGRVNANGTVSGIYNTLEINNTLSVDSLKFDDVLIGNVTGKGDWDTPNNRLLVDLDVLRDAQRVVRVTGFYAPGLAAPLDLTAMLDNAPIKLAEPLLRTLFRDMSGTAVGMLHLYGPLSAPNLVGNVDVTAGRLTFNYLGTTYTFADRIRFAEDGIALRDIKVRDVFGNLGSVDGNIYYKGFQDMRLDLRGSFRKLQVLNTTRRDNDLYFGQAFATGDATVRGPADNLFIRVNAKSEAGTRLSLPLDNAAKAQQASYIRFVNHNIHDTTTTVKVPVAAAQKVDLSGIRLNMNLDVTPDAYMEILLDESTGDIIRGTAVGQLRLNIDTRGDFNMFGQVEIVRGAYNFTLQGLVNKEFVVRPGGLITWNGDPLAGEMNVTATYTQRTSLAPLFQGSTNGTGTSNGAVVPVTAVMNLTGPLLLPTIKLGLEFNDAPSTLEGDLVAFTSALRNDEQELNRQVFSLLVFKQLSPQGQFTQLSLQGQDNKLQNSLGQIVSSQLGLLTSQIDENLEIDFNINGLTAEQLQALQVRLSYSFMNGRLRVTREGGFSSSSNTSGTLGPTTNTSTQASLLGDLSLEYYLQADGKFRAKLRYETTPRDLETINQPRAGLSLLNTQQFDSFQELFARKRLRRREAARRRAREVLNIDDDPRTIM
ncbi:translocation/assembly module TamB domain-containing protein [Hymenobacter sp. GOD-10R]|uniref:translocation/assembly module TamB domain-containing protein n=1 Tax=Hymenobacter sp. GOD-10R TaxID=3093922 RepID=UPI002D77ED8E|nr:translocation/assembly module TamB domain-containing protein [Hymenobacter sp. GOD-10R]WRQ29863.1 translocation/assembly module TamB domain-containing protein [Hymenobacter sp. GOD-10R]